MLTNAEKPRNRSQPGDACAEDIHKPVHANITDYGACQRWRDMCEYKFRGGEAKVKQQRRGIATKVHGERHIFEERAGLHATARCYIQHPSPSFAWLGV